MVVAGMGYDIAIVEVVVALAVQIVLFVAQEADSIGTDVLAAFVEAFVGVEVVDV